MRKIKEMKKRMKIRMKLQNVISGVTLITVGATLTTLSLVMLTLTSITVYAEQLNSKAIEEHIYCPCGCGEILANCHCETAISTRTQIQEKLIAGLSPEAIIRDLTATYGSTILVDENKARVSSNSADFGIISLYALGIIATAFVAYHIGKLSSRFKRGKKKKDWELK